MSRSITVRGAVLGSVLTLALAASASAKDYAQTARNIIPSGQYGGVPGPPGADTQAHDVRRADAAASTTSPPPT